MHAAEWVKSSLFQRTQYFLLHTHHILCSLSSANGPVGSQAWPALSNAVITTAVLRPLSVPDFVTLAEMSKIEIFESQ